MNSEQLRKAILERFGDELQSIGSDVKIIETHQLPEKGLAENKSYIRCLGNLGKHAIWVVKTGVKIIAIYALFLGSLPTALHNTKVYFPRQYEVVVKVGRGIMDGSYFDRPTAYVSSQDTAIRPSGLFVYNHNWLDDEEQYVRDRSRFNDGDFQPLMFSGSTATPTVATTLVTAADVKEFEST